MPRAWFARDLEVVESPEAALAALWNPDFDPAYTAILEQPLEGISEPQRAKVRQSKADLHELAYEYSSDTDALLVLSEVYYPAGWKAYLDGTQTPIYPTNYILRGVRVPAGEHTLKLRFEPESYSRSIKLSLAGLSLTLLALAAGLIWRYIPKRKEYSA